jgi:hypothetical protein
MDRALLAAGLLAIVALAAALLRRRTARPPRRVDPVELGLGPSQSGRHVGVVGFSTPFCLPCRAWEAALGQAGIDFAKVDVAARPELARRYAVRATPLILAVGLPRGEVIESYGGEPRPGDVERLVELSRAGPSTDSARVGAG